MKLVKINFAISQIVSDLVQGEFMQLGSKETENERFAHYLTKTYRKTASLIANCLKAVNLLFFYIIYIYILYIIYYILLYLYQTYIYIYIYEKSIYLFLFVGRSAKSANN
jgi:hypothetical protein